jgi:hypothetical protein
MLDQEHTQDVRKVRWVPLQENPEEETANRQAGRLNKGFAPLLLHFIVGASGVMLDLQIGTGHQIEYTDQ